MPEPEPITRTLMQKFDVPNSAYETVIMVVEMAPQVNSGLHTHPGFDAAYLLEGGLTVLERGQPEKSIRPGESWRVPPGFGARGEDRGSDHKGARHLRRGKGEATGNAVDRVPS